MTKYTEENLTKVYIDEAEGAEYTLEVLPNRMVEHLTWEERPVCMIANIENNAIAVSLTREQTKELIEQLEMLLDASKG